MADWLARAVQRSEGMGVEIERKFLVSGDGWRAGVVSSVDYRQGYLAHGPRCSVRVRIGAGSARLNLKSATVGLRRSEFDYPVPMPDAEEMLRELCASAIVEKTRHRVAHAGHVWEIDVFRGENAGLVLAEIELRREDEDFERPPWLGEEVTRDGRYYSAALAERPYRHWR